MAFRVPLRVRCVKPAGAVIRRSHPDLDFGTPGVLYDVSAVVPNGCYYVLRGVHLGPLLGEPGAPNHLVNMARFEPVEWMTENGIEKEQDDD